ncbi:lipopolysaccharide-assembly, LptC-related protein [Methylobacterium sp. 77]|uniref:lipopolysaccharide-assembly, LptC-related protein n=1 Tax=Methylobacterium sp. 77 TaxID=1101192 RepID=UPI0006868401|nr:lipopolysaccharide-assembly, LptC-related protein [Methylobacterium sp. 77]
MHGVDAIHATGTTASGVDARRHRAHTRARSHSTQVRYLRRLIPLAAGAAIVALAVGTLFNPFGTVLPAVTMGPVTLSGTKVKMENPRLSGFRKGDRGYEVIATAAFQDVRKPTLIELQAMKGHLVTDDSGGLAHMEAAAGLFDSARETLSLERDIKLWTDKGEDVRLQTAAIDFKAGTVKSDQAVAVTLPTGTVVSDSLDMVDNGRVISFIGNVHALFHGSDKAESQAASEIKPDVKSPRILTSAAEPQDGEDRR